MSLSPNEKYPGATEADPNYKDSKFKDNNPSTTNNGSPLKALDRNEQLALQEAMMNAAGFDYNGVVDTPQNSQMFNAYKAALSNGANLLSNHNFLTSSPDTTGPDATQPPPSATPTSYPPGFQIFSGVFANETTGILNLTYIDGRVSFSGGDFYMAVPNTGALENITEFVASVADFNGKPRTRGVSFALVGDEYRVTVGVDALEDESANETLLGSVKFEQGSVATGHEVRSRSSYTNPSFGSFSEMSGLAVGDSVSIDGFYTPNDGGAATFIIQDSAPIDKPYKSIGGGLFAVYLDQTVKLRQYGITPNDEANITRNTDLAIEFWSSFGYLVDNYCSERDKKDYYFTNLDLKLSKSGTSINNFNMVCIADTITTPVLDFDTPDSTISFTRILNMSIMQASSVVDFKAGVYSKDRDFWSTDITAAGGSRKSAPRTTIDEVRFKGFKCAIRAAMWNSKLNKVNFDQGIISACLVGTSINLVECYTVGNKHSFALGCDYDTDTDTILQTSEGLAYSHFDTFLNDQLEDSVLLLGRVQGCTITSFGCEEFASGSVEYTKGLIKIAPSIDGPSNLKINGGTFVQTITSQCLIDSTLNTASGPRTTVGLESVALREVDRIFVNDESGNVSPVLNNNDDFNSTRGSNQYGSQHMNVDSRVPIVPPTTRNKFEVQFNAASQDATMDEYQLNTALRPGNRIRIPVGASVGNGQGFFLSAKFDVFPMYSSPSGANSDRFAYGSVNAHLYRFNNTGNADLVSSYSPIISTGLTDRVSVTYGFYPSSSDLYVDLQINSDDPSQTSMFVGYVRAGSNFTTVRKIEVL